MKISYFQFAKWLLEGSSVAMPLDPGYEGGTIAAEVLDASDSLRELCSKCGRNLTCMSGMLHAMPKCHRALWICYVAKCLNTCMGGHTGLCGIAFPA